MFFFTVLKTNMIFIGICGSASNLAACIYSSVVEPTPLNSPSHKLTPVLTNLSFTMSNIAWN